MDAQPLIDYKKVNINQQGFDILTETDFQLYAGEFVYLIGKVGTGKSSFLKTIYGELEISNGEATVLGYDMRKIKAKHISELRRQLGIVFQDFQLLIDRNVHDNLEFVLKATGWKNESEREFRIQEALSMVKMENKGYKMPNELSGGEQQRIVIARAILNKPQIILADEPTGNLDAETGKKIVEVLKKISEQGAAVSITTHNLNHLNDFPGKVYRCENHHLSRIDTH